MEEQDCVFCKIIKGEISSVKIWEDKEHIAILDIMLKTEGMTLVIPKKHFDSYAFDMPEDDYNKFLLATRGVAKILERGLDVKRVVMVMEGLGVNHAHIKLYPIYGLAEKFEETWAPDKIYFEKYEGYISTQTGERKDILELKKLAEEIKKNR